MAQDFAQDASQDSITEPNVEPARKRGRALGEKDQATDASAEGRINSREIEYGDYGDEQGNMPPIGGRGPGDDAVDENNSVDINKRAQDK